MTSKYVMKVNGMTYTIPKENLIVFAHAKALQLNSTKSILTDKDAIEFLETLGLEISEGTDESNN